jgi:hypothetical protein
VILFDVLVILVGSANVLWLPAYRKPPAVVFLAALAGLLLASNLLPDPRVTVAAKGIAITIYMVVLIGFPHWLAGIAREEADFDTQLRSILEPVLKAQNAWGRVHRKQGGGEGAIAQSGAKQACDDALSELEGVVPPSPEWARTADLLRAYLLAVRDRAAWRGSGDGAGPEPPTDEAIHSMVRELDDAWDRALRVRWSRPSG